MIIASDTRTIARVDDGADGVGIASVVPQYYLSSSSTACEDGEWTEEMPDWQEGYFLWTRSYITWNDGTASATTPVLAGAINSANEKIVEVEANLEQTSERIKASVSALETTSDSTSSTLAALTVALGELQTYVDTSITSADESIRQELSSLISQTAAQVEATFTQVNSRIDTVDGDLTEAIEEIQSYIRLSSEGVEIGASDSDYTALLSNDRLEFRESGTVVAYISNNKMHITALEVTESARLTCWEFRQRSNGHGIIRYKALS